MSVPRAKEVIAPGLRRGSGNQPHVVIFAEYRIGGSICNQRSTLSVVGIKSL